MSPERATRLRAPGFVGRQRELAAVTDALNTPSAVVLVEGEAGVGKTRLLREFIAATAGREHRMLVAECPPFREPQTLGPVVTAIRQATSGIAGLTLSGLAGALRPLFPEWAGELPPLPELAEDATAARHRVFRALAELLGQLGISVLAVEDAQWADEATLEFVLFVQPQVSLVITYRPEDIPAGSLLLRLSSRPAQGGARLRLSLNPLDANGTADLVSSMLDGEPVSAEFAGFLHERTEGLPLAVEELVRLMHDRADIAHGSNGWVRHPVAEIAVPPTVRDAVLERAGRLTPDTRVVLEAAAVLSEPATAAALYAVTGLPRKRAQAGLTEALGCGLLAETSRGLVAFRHVLAAQAVRDAIPAPRLPVLHLRAAEALERLAPVPVNRLARHYREAGDAERWRRYGERVADEALASGDEATAFAVLRDLLTAAAPPPGEVAELARKIPVGTITGYARYEEMVLTLRNVIAAGIADPGDEAEVRMQLGRMLMAMDQFEDGVRQLEQAIPRLRQLTTEAAAAMINLGWPRGATARWPASVHLQWLRRAARIPPPSEPGERLRLVVDRATALLHLGERDGWTEAARIPSVPSTATERRQVTRGHLNIGDSAMKWGRYDEAERLLTRAEDLAAEYGYDRLRGDIQVARCHLRWFTGAWDGLAERAAQLAAGEDFPMIRMEAAMVTGLLQAAAGAAATAEETLWLTLNEFGRYGADEIRMEAAAGLARLALADGRTQDALEITADLAGIVSGKGIWLWADDLGPARVAALAAAGQTSEAREFTGEFARGLRGRDIPSARAALMLCQAIIADGEGPDERAAELFIRAGAAWQALPRPYQAALAQERAAAVLFRAGQPAEAAAQVTSALAVYDRLGASRDRARAALLARQHGVVLARRHGGGRRGYGTALSPQERTVADLAARGQTNKEIAARLFISPQTVDKHMRSVMRKMGIRSRTELAYRLASGGRADPGKNGETTP